MKYIIAAIVLVLLVIAIVIGVRSVDAPTTMPEGPAAPPMPESPVGDEDADQSGEVPADVQAAIDAKADLIRLEAPAPLQAVTSPLTIRGEARGTWYFEASFPVVLVDWDGRIIAEGYAEAQGDWMTEEFVPFTVALTFESPYAAGDQSFMQRGALILQKANASGLPERDDALEVPVRFAP